MFLFDKSKNKWYNWNFKSKSEELIKKAKTPRIKRVLKDISVDIEKEIEEIGDLEDAEAYIRYFAYYFLENRKYFEEMRDEALKEYKENKKFQKFKETFKELLNLIDEGDKDERDNKKD